MSPGNNDVDEWPWKFANPLIFTPTLWLNTTMEAIPWAWVCFFWTRYTYYPSCYLNKSLQVRVLSKNVCHWFTICSENEKLVICFWDIFLVFRCLVIIAYPFSWICVRKRHCFTWFLQHRQRDRYQYSKMLLFLLRRFKLIATIIKENLQSLLVSVLFFSAK